MLFLQWIKWSRHLQMWRSSTLYFSNMKNFAVYDQESRVWNQVIKVNFSNQNSWSQLQMFPLVIWEWLPLVISDKAVKLFQGKGTLLHQFVYPAHCAADIHILLLIIKAGDPLSSCMVQLTQSLGYIFSSSYLEEKWPHQKDQWGFTVPYAEERTCIKGLWIFLESSTKLFILAMCINCVKFTIIGYRLKLQTVNRI